MNGIQLDLNIPSSLRVYLNGLFIIFIIYISAPIYYPYSGTLLGMFYLYISVFMVFIGLIIGEGRFRFKSKKIKLYISKRKLKLLFKILVFIAFVGVILRVYDKYFLRGASLFQNLVQNREALSSEEANIFSVISSFLYPFSFIIPFFYLLLRKENMIKDSMLWFLLPIALFPVIDNILFGSRSSILVFGTLVIFYLIILDYIKFKSKIKIIFFIFFITAFLFILNGYMFSFRTELMGMDPINSTQISAYAKFAYLDEHVKLYLYKIKDSILYFYILGFVNLAQYFIHGIFELFYLVDNFDTKNIFYGQIDFFVFLKFFSKVFFIQFDPSSMADENIIIRSGVYTTFFGPAYYDFAFGGLIFSFIFGIFTGFIGKNVQKNIALVPLYAFLLVILFFMPVVSLWVSAQGTYLVISFLLFYIISLLLKFNSGQVRLVLYHYKKVSL